MFVIRKRFGVSAKWLLTRGFNNNSNINEGMERFGSSDGAYPGAKRPYIPNGNGNYKVSNNYQQSQAQAPQPQQFSPQREASTPPDRRSKPLSKESSTGSVEKVAKVLEIPADPLKTLIEGAMIGTQTSLTEEQLLILSEPISMDKIELRYDGNLYLPSCEYRSILDRAFGVGGWCLVPLNGLSISNDKMAMRDYALIAQGRVLAQATGESGMRLGVGDLTNVAEIVRGNGLARCCKYLGVASDLWNASFTERFRKNHCEWVVDNVTGRRSIRKKI